ncbi:CTP:molybdopterin cytidylyltransferase MocA [Trichlorobacter thiogenes]|uniref:CTP:molybdopterin cytidylyltransferase MocA n=1 Tax=Trichlorobacter thiogenes TaxID=115783 RepID=A0A1T4NIG3_9BACT|nr:nucleotidyltransferase family protein [Trichlorobacter thiogenes]SJZ79111.1 CTP:molybdopterin cytidylyltransferase MocA [Trichlorobacter thiogenes]
MKTAAIILAAGFSSRMGTDKALLPFGDTTALELLVASYATAGVARIMVVTGQNHDTLVQLCLPVELARNPAPENGMFPSIQCGIAAVEPAVDAFFVHPVDTPLVSPVTLTGLIAALQQHPAVDGVIPAYCGKRGHPPLLRVRLLPELLSANGDGGLRSLYQGWQMLELASDDQAVILDMNTPEQYALLKGFSAEQTINRQR